MNIHELNEVSEKVSELVNIKTLLENINSSLATKNPKFGELSSVSILIAKKSIISDIEAKEHRLRCMMEVLS